MELLFKCKKDLKNDILGVYLSNGTFIGDYISSGYRAITSDLALKCFKENIDHEDNTILPIKNPIIIKKNLSTSQEMSLLDYLNRDNSNFHYIYLKKY